MKVPLFWAIRFRIVAAYWRARRELGLVPRRAIPGYVAAAWRNTD